MAKNKDKNKDIDNIIKNYKNMEKEIVNQLNYIASHGTISGSNREYIWKELFERIIPQKFNIERGVFIIDSFGKISKEVDLAIYDEQYTPYIFRYGTLKFIPIESVAAVIECKSTGATEGGLLDWLESINGLNTGTDSIVRINGFINYGIDIDKLIENNTVTQTNTTPIKILCHMGVSEKYTKEFDIVIEAEGKLSIKFKESYKNLFDWYLHLNHYPDFIYPEIYKERENKLKEFIEKCKNSKESRYDGLRQRKLEDYKIDEDNTILSFIFQFNQLLMLINNPLFFPHMDYVRMFKGNFKNLEK